VLDAFGDRLAYTLRRVQSGDGTLTLTGILDAGIELEIEKPGEGVLARLFVRNSDLVAPPPVPGDEIETAKFVYSIVDIDIDAGGGVFLWLRQARPVI
jgi:hypothetical protein